MASRRISERELGEGSLGVDGDEDDFRQRSNVRLPTCCLIHRRAICAISTAMALVVVIVAAIEGALKSSGETPYAGSSPPWVAEGPPGLHHGSPSQYEPQDEIGEDDDDPLAEDQDRRPDPAPAPPPYDRLKFDRIKDRILEHGISHASALEDPRTPQHRALAWLVGGDARRLDVPPRDDGPPTTGAALDEEQALFQRYSLAVLWHQTTDPDTVRESTTGSAVEDPFDAPFDPLGLTKEDLRWWGKGGDADDGAGGWMSPSGLCSWRGVTCHPRGGDRLGTYDGDFYVATLNLTNANVHGVVPREVFTGLGRMKALDLSLNELEGTIGGELGRLGDLEDLFIFDNNFSGVLPDDIGDLSNLYNLYINDNKFRGRLPSEIGKLSKLRGISLFNNTFDGRVPDSIGDLKDVIALYLDENAFTGQVPTALGGMTSLIDLRLRDNDFSGTIPTELGNLNNLETIYLDTNGKITGPIPTELSNLKKLTELHLYDMNLKGRLPPALALLQGLVYLYLDKNDLTGPIPEEWGQMPDLEQLFLSGNALSGRLPRTMRGLESLQMLRVADNELSGPIPTDLGELTKLEYVYLEGNNFSKVPTELGELTKLKLLHLHDNKFGGEMPPGICNLKDHFFLDELTADCEEIACTCCECDP